MGVYNQLTNKHKNKTTSDYGCNNTGIAFGGGLGSQLQGFQKVIPSHPVANSLVNTVGAPNTAGNTSKFEGFEYSVSNYGTGALTQTANYFPRALVSRHKVLNNDFIMPAVQTSGATNAATYVMGSVYYGA